MQDSSAVGFILLSAIVPTIIYVWVLWWLDRYEQEPRRLLVSAFVWGAVPAVAVSAIGETILGQPFAMWDEASSALVLSSLIAPAVEEAAKGLAVLLIFLLFYQEFDDVLDGIIYGATVGFGFAMTENALYFFRGYGAGGMEQLTALVLVRGVVFGLNHALYTSAFGAALGYARTAHHWWLKWIMPFCGFCAAITLHAIHNLFASLTDVTCYSLVLSIVSDWGGVAVMFVVIILAWQKEKAWIASHLLVEVDTGLISRQEYEMIGSYRRRLGAQWRALIHDGTAEVRRLRNLAQWATELAFKLEQKDQPAATALRAKIEQLRQPPPLA
jgi:protease PrsW